MKVTIASVQVYSIKEGYGAPLELSKRRFRKGGDDEVQERVTGAKEEGD